MKEPILAMVICIAWLVYITTHPATPEDKDLYLLGYAVVISVSIILMMISSPANKRRSRSAVDRPYDVLEGGTYNCPNCGKPHHNVKSGTQVLCTCGTMLNFNKGY
jgi:hypothetical protein